MTQKEQIENLKKQNDKLRKDNIFLRLDLEIIAADPRSEKAREIIIHYQKLMLARDERLKEIQN